MKTISKGLLFIMLLISISSFAQEIPNPSFEEWVIGAPIGWFGFGIAQSSDAFQGSFSVRIDAFDDINVPLLIAGDVVPGFNVSERYGSFKGFYKLNPNGNDFLKVDVIMGFTGDVVGIGSFQFQGTQDFWTAFTVPISYSSEVTPNDALIFLSITNDEGTATPGSNAVVDFVSFDEITDIEQIGVVSEENFQLSNYPNPFDESTTIAFELNEPTEVNLDVYNLTGRKVATLLKKELLNSGLHEFRFDSMALPSGLYFYTLSNADNVIMRKMNCIK